MTVERKDNEIICSLESKAKILLERNFLDTHHYEITVIDSHGFPSFTTISESDIMGVAALITQLVADAKRERGE